MDFDLKKVATDTVGKNSGFTLIELMIVVTIIGILAAASIFSFMHARDRARVGACVASLGGIKTAMEIYHSDEGKYPVGPLGSFDDIYTELGNVMNDQKASKDMTCEFVSYDGLGTWYTLETIVRKSSPTPANIRLTENEVLEY